MPVPAVRNQGMAFTMSVTSKFPMWRPHMRKLTCCQPPVLPSNF